jgi:hypothetical protein
MHLIVNTDGSVAALGPRVLSDGPGQVLVTLLDPETARAEHALAAIAPARDAFLAAVQARGQAARLNDLAGLDKALTAALAALTAAQIDAGQAGADLAKAEQGVRDAFAAAELDAGKQFGDRGQVWWDGKSFQVRERAVDPAEEQRAADVAAVVAKARENPDFALLARLLGVDTSDEAAVAAAFAARRQG